MFMALKPASRPLRHHTTPRARAKAASAIAALALLASANAALAQEPTLSEIQRDREGLRFKLGAGTLGGSLDFRSTPSFVQTDLGQLPSLSLGMQGWLNENAGYDLTYQGSFFGSINVALNGQQQALGLTAHRAEGAFLYRWFTGPRITSMAFGLRLGFLLHNITPSPHTPTILLSTTWFGPLAGLTARVPFTAWLGLEAEASLILPFNVRESPDRSGNPRDPKGYHAAGALYLRLSDALTLRARADYRRLEAGFSGEGNRGLGGVTNAYLYDQFLSPQLQLEWIP
jgi:hypothetical protein